jgi:hypothetical protein
MTISHGAERFLTTLPLPPDPAMVGEERWRDMWKERIEQHVNFPARWLQHQRRDDYWKQGSICENWNAIACPVFAVGGWLDGYTQTVFRLVENLKSPCKGLIGPWGHKEPQRGVPGPAIGFLQECLRWWDQSLKGQDRWHQDAPYYFVDGEQTVSFWIPMEPVDDATLRCIAGSHKWPKFVTPTRWLSEENFYPGENDYLPVPDPDKEPENFRLLEWPLQPSDAVAFHYKTVHGARGNLSSRRCRAFSLRWLGDDARFVTRPGRTSPPFPGHNMTDGQPLREDWFPIIWRNGCEN